MTSQQQRNISNRSLDRQQAFETYRYGDANATNSVFVSMANDLSATPITASDAILEVNSDSDEEQPQNLLHMQEQSPAMMSDIHTAL